MTEYKLSEESAQEIFDKIVNKYELDLKEEDDNPRKTNLIKNILEAIRKGRLEADYNENGQFIITQFFTQNYPGLGDKLVYGEVKMKHQQMFDQKLAEEPFKRMGHIAASLAGGKSYSKLEELSLVDSRLLIDIMGLLFL